MTAQPIRSRSRESDRPDAVTFPRPGTGEMADEAREEAVEIAEHHLQCGPFELAWVRDQVRYMFATRDPEDCEFHPSGHERAGTPRYRWVDVGGGVKLGWLIDA